MRLETRVIRQLVDALLLDHGGVHVGEEQLLAPPRRGLHDDVDTRGEVTQSVGERPLVEAGACAKADVGRGRRREPAWFAGFGKQRPHVRHGGRREDASRRDKGYDMGHGTAAKAGLKAVLIAGPTASGKSAIALAAAERLGGIVINADSMQVYRDLRVLTARPTAEDEARVPHRLYGFVDAAENYSAGRWCRDVETALDEAAASQRVPVIVGGTGLYFKALTKGLAAVPSIPADIRSRVR